MPNPGDAGTPGVPGASGTHRRFDEEEVALILRRAAELQEAQSGAADGMTLADLEEVAREAGLDPALVRRAAADLEAGSGARGVRDTYDSSDNDYGAESPVSRFLGAPTVLREERIVDSEVPAAEYETLVDEIRRTFNDVGTVSTLGRTLAWRSSPPMPGRSGGRQINVTVVVRGGKTGIRVEESTGGLAGGLFGGLMGGLGGGSTGLAVGVGLGALHSGLAAAGIFGVFLGGSYVLARTIFTSMSRRRALGLRALADRLASHIEDAVGQGPGTRHQAPESSI